MMTITKAGDVLDISSLMTPPAIYLDHWALRCLSTDSLRHDRFLGAFRKSKGTLLFSWANVVEVSSNTGASADNIQHFLTEVGEQWFPLEINPIKVIEREYTTGNNSPCFAAGFLEAYCQCIHDGPLTLSTIVNLTQDDRINRACRENLEKLKREIGQLFEQWRSEQEFNIETFHRDPLADCSRPTEFVFNGLRRLIQKEKFKIDPNDPLDFLHTTASLAYGNLVLLDKHWADLAQKLKMPSDRVRVYSSKQLDRFLEDLKHVRTEPA